MNNGLDVTEHTFRFIVLLRGLKACIAKLDSMCGKILMKLVVVIFPHPPPSHTLILENFDWFTELDLNNFGEFDEFGNTSDFFFFRG